MKKIIEKKENKSFLLLYLAFLVSQALLA